MSTPTSLRALRRQISSLFLERLAQTAGLGVDSAQQIIAEVGPQAASFDWAGQLAFWGAVRDERRALPIYR